MLKKGYEEGLALSVIKMCNDGRVIKSVYNQDRNRTNQ